MRVLVNTIFNILANAMTGNLLTSVATISFFRKSLFLDASHDSIWNIYMQNDTVDYTLIISPSILQLIIGKKATSFCLSTQSHHQTKHT